MYKRQALNFVIPSEAEGSAVPPSHYTAPGASSFAYFAKGGIRRATPASVKAQLDVDSRPLLACGNNVRNLKLQPAVPRVHVLLQLVGEVDHGALLQPERLDARSPVPSQGSPTGAMCVLGDLQAYVAIFDGSHRGSEARVVGDEDRLFIAVAERFQPCLLYTSRCV